MGHCETSESGTAARPETPAGRRNALRSRAPASLCGQFDWIQKMYDDEHRLAIEFRYELGLRLKEIRDDRDAGRRRPRYGTYAIEAIRNYFDWDDSVIFQALKVADNFTADDIARACSLRSPAGEPVPYRYLVYAAGITDPAERWSLLERAASERWPVAGLPAARESNGEEALGPKYRFDRLPQDPKDFDDVIRQQARSTDDLLGMLARVWTPEGISLSGRLRALEPEDYTRGRAARIKGNAERLGLLAKEAQERANEAMEVYYEYLGMVDALH